MVSSYVRMQCPLEEAMARYGRWIELPELSPPRLVAERDAWAPPWLDYPPLMHQSSGSSHRTGLASN